MEEPGGERSEPGVKMRDAGALAVGFLIVAVGAAPAHPQAAPVRHHTYVLVHGAMGGSYAWRTVDSMLTRHGHRVVRPSLTGQVVYLGGAG